MKQRKQGSNASLSVLGVRLPGPGVRLSVRKTVNIIILTRTHYVNTRNPGTKRPRNQGTRQTKQATRKPRLAWSQVPWPPGRRRRHGHRGSSSHAELLFKRLHQLRELQHRQVANRINDFFLTEPAPSGLRLGFGHFNYPLLSDLLDPLDLLNLLDLLHLSDFRMQIKYWLLIQWVQQIQQTQ